jgi:hypothetical protein
LKDRLFAQLVPATLEGNPDDRWLDTRGDELAGFGMIEYLYGSSITLPVFEQWEMKRSLLVASAV